MHSLFTSWKRTAALIILASLLLVTTEKPAKADPFGDNIGGQIVVAGLLVGAVVGVGLYLLLRKGPSITGCAAADAGGFALTDEGDHRAYQLGGDTGGIVAGHRVHVYGSRHRAGSEHQFLVKRSPRDLGPCKATP